MIATSFLTGMALCAAAFLLIQAEENRMVDKFGAAFAKFANWCAFGMLLMAGTYGLGILIPGSIAAVVLVVRTMNFGDRLSALARYKLPAAIGALLCSIVAWIGVLNMMEELPNG
jgi:hypothetical protein